MLALQLRMTNPYIIRGVFSRGPGPADGGRRAGLDRCAERGQCARRCVVAKQADFVAVLIGDRQIAPAGREVEVAWSAAAGGSGSNPARHTCLRIDIEARERVLAAIADEQVSATGRHLDRR